MDDSFHSQTFHSTNVHTYLSKAIVEIIELLSNLATAAERVDRIFIDFDNIIIITRDYVLAR